MIQDLATAFVIILTAARIYESFRDSARRN